MRSLYRRRGPLSLNSCTTKVCEIHVLPRWERENVKRLFLSQCDRVDFVPAEDLKDRIEARIALGALIYSFCTEIFHTRDLKQAKYWIDEPGLSLLDLGEKEDPPHGRAKSSRRTGDSNCGGRSHPHRRAHFCRRTENPVVDQYATGVAMLGEFNWAADIFCRDPSFIASGHGKARQRGRGQQVVQGRCHELGPPQSISCWDQFTSAGPRFIRNSWALRACEIHVLTGWGAGR